MENLSIERLEKLKDVMILNNLAEVDLDNKSNYYDTLLYKTFNGEFDDSFLSNNLDGLNDTERNEVLSLARKYNYLCFYLGEFENWVDSVEGVTLLDLDLISEKLLDNYDYLIKLALNGEDVLKFLGKFQNNELFKKGSVIALLRNGFYNDDVLESILIEMSKADGNYKEFNDNQKIILCNYPLGVLYRVVGEDTNIISLEELKKMITIKLIGEEDSSFDIGSIEDSEFEEVISSIYTDNYINK